MAITEKKPSTKYTVGAQYICFNTDADWDVGYQHHGQFEFI